MTVRILIGLLLVLATASAAGGQPGALLDLDTGASLVTNDKAIAVGDVVTIMIVEQTSADAASSVGANSKSEVSGGPSLGFLQPFGSWGLDTENKFTGNGNTARSGNLQGEISARVAEVMPGGLLRLVGTRTVEINGDRQLIEVTGVCRTRDIAADNTILSTYIADARIAYSGTGALQDAAQPGLITRVVNWLF
ncbi:MAG: flagellar basal body L-ring protein FlgH [Candidatus Krumholzibacteriia bacterium]